ncbi:hypothetical protein GHT06_004011 [Daphnia sinensis]|uniref:Glucokinase n=1 Tax=Daphnia sinensis TaxID=1820382 RepID=A0AAD5L2J5_9CRUS|nr:hypothetical protein GHT06_004011 [Daphnia sinensis]
MEKAILGLDIGGTGIKGGVLVNGHLKDIRSIETPAEESQEYILETIASFIESYLPHDFAGIGIGIPGLVDVKQVGITLGTGVGGGIVINGQLYSGVNSAAGEWCNAAYLDHNYEHYCSGKFFHTYYHNRPKALAKLALNGDQVALKAFEEYGHHLGELIKNILYALAPEAIVLGGSIRKTYPLFKKSLHQSLSTFAYPTVLNNLKILLSELDETAIHGAVALVDVEQDLVKI